MAIDRSVCGIVPKVSKATIRDILVGNTWKNI